MFVQSGAGEMGGRIVLNSGEGNNGSGGDVEILSATSASSLDGRYVVTRNFLVLACATDYTLVVCFVPVCLHVCVLIIYLTFIFPISLMT